MKEAEAQDFDFGFAIENDATPISVRHFVKSGENHINEVSDNEHSFSVSSSWNISLDEWKALALACEHAGFSAKVMSHEKGIAVW
jgi:hypothetical protein